MTEVSLSFPIKRYQHLVSSSRSIVLIHALPHLPHPPPSHPSIALQRGTYQERIPANLVMTPAGYGHPTAILILIHLTILSSQQKPNNQEVHWTHNVNVWFAQEGFTLLYTEKMISASKGQGVTYPNSGCSDGFADDLILGIIHSNFTERIRKAWEKGIKSIKRGVSVAHTIPVAWGEVATAINWDERKEGE